LLASILKKRLEEGRGETLYEIGYDGEISNAIDSNPIRTRVRDEALRARIDNRLRHARQSRRYSERRLLFDSQKNRLRRWMGGDCDDTKSFGCRRGLGD
jgi:hypothetical protein